MAGTIYAGRNGYAAARNSRSFADWSVSDPDINEVVRGDMRRLGARAAAGNRNAAIVHSIVTIMQQGVVGLSGLEFSSRYQADNLADASEEEREHRNQIERAVRAGTRGTSLDAAGALSTKEMLDLAVSSRGLYGEFFAQRLLLPARPGQHTHATCWRVLHPHRCCNPNFGGDTANLKDGIEYDTDGSPVAAWFLSRHPNASNSHGPMRWTRIPIFDEGGERQLIWYANREYPEQRRGVGWFGPVLGLIRHLDKTTEAHVVAKRLQACIGLIILVKDPEAAAAGDPNGEVLSPRTKIVPGKIYYGQVGQDIRPFVPRYTGTDFQAFSDQLLELICAGVGPGVPVQFVRRQLTQANLASSRAALMQAWHAFMWERFGLEVHVLQPIVESLIAEDLARERLVLPTGDDLVAACEGTFVRPKRLTTDDAREVQGAGLRRELGVSQPRTLEDLGFDPEEERRREVEHRKRDAAAGLDRTDPVGATAVDDPDDDPDARDDGRRRAPPDDDDDDDDEGGIEEPDE